MRVLVVEDEPKIAAAIKKGLMAERFTVDVVDEAESGLSYSRSDDYDLIILDRMLPGGMDGLDICKTLRAEGISTPVILLTAKDQVPDRVAGLNAGADDYLIKPFSFNELVARVRALLRRPTKTDGPKLKVGEMELDPLKAQATHKGVHIRLTAREYAILEYLMRHAGQIVSKDQLIQHVWNDDSDILPNTVEVYIGYLRAKLDRPFGTHVLKTVRGFGYSFEAA